MTEKEFFHELMQGLSQDRLLKYRRSQRSPEEQLAYYAWNTALCEALYPSLHAFEVALRNRIHKTLTDQFTAYWYERTDFLEQDEARAITEAKQSLDKHRKPLTPPYVISELNLGFWCALFNRRYERKIWPMIGITWFPNLHRSERTREKLSSRVEHIRRIRNRVFHFEPLWDSSTLFNDYENLIATIDSINPCMKEATLLFDHFPEVFTNHVTPYQDRIREYLARLDKPEGEEA